MDKYKIVLGLGLTLLGFGQADAQGTSDLRPVLTAVPSLQITPDARAGGMGELGVAISPDVYAQYWNASKYAFAPTQSEFSLSYTPWMTKIVNDVALVQATGYYKLGKDQRQALGASVRYFSFGKVLMTDIQGYGVGEVYPSELSIDLSYSRQLRQDLALGVALRYIHSNRDGARENARGSALVVDLSAYLQRGLKLFGREGQWSLGLNIKNLGSKLSYDGGATSLFLPTNLGLGASILHRFDEVNRLSLSFEANKLLVPLSPIPSDFADTDEGRAEYNAAILEHRSVSALSGIFKSFGDAKGGLAEELREVRWSLGAEYSYQDKFFLRAGYSYLHPTKGNLQALTAGAGFKTRAFSIDASYMVGTSHNNPLDGTLRFSLGVSLEGVKELFK